MAAKQRKKTARDSSNRFRIVGGAWRGRRLSFPADSEIRPTPDRVRETLFNWLQPSIRGARCLDLFAGSGALGLEALSRGAKHTVFVERASASAARINEHLELLGASGSVQCCDAFDFLKGNADTFDLVLLDPPFAGQLLQPALRALIGHGALARGARVYLESPRGELQSALPPELELTRSGKAGRVEYGLAELQERAVTD